MTWSERAYEAARRRLKAAEKEYERARRAYLWAGNRRLAAASYDEYLERPDLWRPASGGTETPFTTRTGRKLLYCFNPATGKHAYLDLGTDMILTQEEAEAALNLY